MEKFYMMHRDSKEYKDWFIKGNEDLKVAKLIFPYSDFTDTVGYHLHQAIEKYLKGFLLFNNYDYPSTHNLTELLKKCFKFNQDITDYYEECERINGYYIESKYPMDPPRYYPREEMIKSIEMTEFTIKYIKRVINYEK